MNKNDYIIRLEEKNDYRAVENLVRESFWNVYKPGCSEHYVIHVLRDDPAFIRELDFVMEQDGSLIGQNMFMKTIIEADDGREIDVLTMGPIGITPKLKRRGYGKALLEDMERLCWIILWKRLQRWVSVRCCLKEISISMARAVLIMPVSLAFDIMICRRMRIHPSFSVRN